MIWCRNTLVYLRVYSAQKRASRRDYFKWLAIGLKVPRDGLGFICSLMSAYVRVALKQWLHRPLVFIVDCCQSSALLSVLLASDCF